MADTKKSQGETDSGRFSKEERAAMKERAKELKAEKSGAKTDTEAEVLAAIGEMPESDRAIAERLHSIIRETAPDLTPKTWYGMPAYAQGGKRGKVICFIQGAAKFDTRYLTLGFNDTAQLDDGTMWPTAFAVTKLTSANEKRIAELVKKAVG